MRSFDGGKSHAANHHGVRVVQLCFDFYMTEAKPDNLVGDRVYDSDPLDNDLREDGIEMIAPILSPQTCDARWTPSSAIRKAMADRKVLRLDSMAAPHSCAMGVLSEDFPRLRATRLPRRPLQIILR